MIHDKACHWLVINKVKNYFQIKHKFLFLAYFSVFLTNHKLRIYFNTMEQVEITPNIVANDNEEWLKYEILRNMDNSTEIKTGHFSIDVSHVPIDIVTKYVLNCNGKNDRTNRCVLTRMENENISLYIMYSTSHKTAQEAMDHVFGEPTPKGHIEQFNALKERVIQHIKCQCLDEPREKIFVDDIPTSIVDYLSRLVYARHKYSVSIWKTDDNRRYLSIFYHGPTRKPCAFVARDVRRDMFGENIDEKVDEALLKEAEQMVCRRAKRERDSEDMIFGELHETVVKRSKNSSEL